MGDIGKFYRQSRSFHFRPHHNVHTKEDALGLLHRVMAGVISYVVQGIEVDAFRYDKDDNLREGMFKYPLETLKINMWIEKDSFHYKVCAEVTAEGEWVEKT